MTMRDLVPAAQCLAMGLLLCMSTFSGAHAQDDDAFASTTATATDSPSVRSRASFELDRDKAVYELAVARAELSSHTLMWPWLVLSAGGGATLVGASYGAARVLDCDGDCRLEAWIGPTVAIGAAVAIASLVWLRSAEWKRGAAQSKVYRAERALEAVDANAPMLAHPELGYSMRWTF